MKALHDKAELKARNTTLLLRNKAYKVTLEYCDETCDDVDMVFMTAKQTISETNMFTTEQIQNLNTMLDTVSDYVKDAGTRKLRKAFTDYVLENTKD